MTRRKGNGKPPASRNENQGIIIFLVIFAAIVTLGFAFAVISRDPTPIPQCRTEEEVILRTGECLHKERASYFDGYWYKKGQLQ